MRRSISLLVKGIFQRDVRTHASSIAFFFFMAFIPLLILLAAVVPFVGIKVSDVIGFFRELMPEGSAGLVSEMIREAFDHSTAALSISLLMLLWTASRGILALITGLNAMYHKKETRKSAKLTLLTIGYTIAFMAFISLVVYMIFSGRMTDLMKAAFPGMRAQPAMITFLEFLSLLIAGTVLFCLVYRYLPSGRRSLLRQLPGAFFTSAGWVLLSMGMRVYISLFNSFTRFYGSLAAVILLLFWFYWIFFLLLAGGYANAHMEQLLPVRFPCSSGL